MAEKASKNDKKYVRLYFLEKLFFLLIKSAKKRQLRSWTSF